MNRTPPKNSLAAELLEPESMRPDLLRTKTMLNDLKDLTERLSDFGSCISSQSSTSSDDSDKDSLAQAEEGFKTANEKKRIKRSKRKLKVTPSKEEFLKKPNLKNN